MKYSAFAIASVVVLAGSNLTTAQDENSAFFTKCPTGQWALTFDDGPSPFTQELLQNLKAGGVKATFFVLGVQVDQANLANATKAAFDDGHVIASHTYDHSDLNTLTAAQITDQMKRTDASIKKVIGRTPTIMRPPYGNCNANCAAVMKQLGYSVVTWNVDSNDWRVVDTPNESQAFDVFTKELATVKTAQVGHISLQHDIHQFSVKMVPKIISAIKAAGLTFTTVDKCINVEPYREGAGSTTSSNTTTPGSTTTAKPQSTSTSSPTPSSSSVNFNSTRDALFGAAPSLTVGWASAALAVLTAAIRA